MRKRIGLPSQPSSPPGEQWMDLVSLAAVEISSESATSSIESALGATEEGSGWRASGPGRQVIRLLFDTPQRLRRVHLKFIELGVERTQEFTIRWSGDGRNYQEVIRQQWNFSPQGATEEVEDYQLDLADVTVLELNIIPDINDNDALASLSRLRLA